MRRMWALVLAGLAVLLAAASAVSGGPGTGDPPPTPTATAAPSPTPPPTPTPQPPPAAHCYRPRPPEFPPSPFVLRPADADSVFQSCQVVSYYGHPQSARMGVLGSDAPEAVVRRLLEQAAAYDAANGGRGVVPALHLVYAVAQTSPMEDGTYLYRMPDAMVQEYLRLAERYDLLVFLDIQMGASSVEAEVPRILPYLRNPRVHLALDPEFVAPPGEPPGRVIGGLEAAEINRAQAILQRLVEAERLPNKVLVVHQFQPTMILNKAALQDLPDVDLVIDMDGFGSAEAKLTKYALFVRDEGAEHGGLKLFYEHDVDLLTPEQVARLAPQPDVVIYQ